MLTTVDLLLLARVALAGAMGFLVGWEREAHGHRAGTRTLALLTLGTAAFTALAIEAFPSSGDRIIANILTGIGFLGAGIILRGNRGGPRGLTTAATVWTMTSVGIIIGTGRLLLGLLLTALVLLLLWWPHLPLLSRLLPRRTRDAYAAAKRLRSPADPAAPTPQDE